MKTKGFKRRIWVYAVVLPVIFLPLFYFMWQRGGSPGDESRVAGITFLWCLICMLWYEGLVLSVKMAKLRIDNAGLDCHGFEGEVPRYTSVDDLHLCPRLILFRGKDKNGKQVYGDCVNGSDLDVRIFSGRRGISERIDPCTLGQFTGMFDSVGNRIFEGDVIESDNGTAYEIVFMPPAFVAVHADRIQSKPILLSAGFLKNKKVTGNIYN